MSTVTYPPIVLASASPRRRTLLTRLGVSFTISVADVDETPRAGERPAAFASRMAAEKAGAVAAGLERGLVVGADTIVVLRGRILGKPDSPDQARQFLRRLRGRRHEVMTGVAVVDAASGHTTLGLGRTHVWLRPFTDAEIEAYVATGDPLDKAGAYAIQHRAFHPVERLEGSETNVIGLPLTLTRTLLASAGARL